MDILSSDDVRHLSLPQEEPVVSIYMPTLRIAGPDFHKDRIQFKNQLRDARRQLQALGVRDKTITPQLHPADQIAKDEYFWAHQDHGLAVLLGRDFSRIYRLPYSFTPLTTVATRYHIKQLLPILGDNYHYYILQISPQQVRLLRATTTRVDILPDQQLPENITDALGEEDTEDRINFRPGTSPSGGAIFHGHGDIKNYKKTELQKYARVVAKRVETLLKNSRAQLVLACAEEFEPMFRKVYHGPQLHGEHLSGNFDEVTPGELHQQTLPKIRDQLEADKTQALEHYHALYKQGAEHVSDAINEVLTATHDGRAATVFARRQPHYWGEVTEGAITRLEERYVPGLVDPSDVAAANAYLAGREVYITEADDVPGDPAAAVILYY